MPETPTTEAQALFDASPIAAQDTYDQHWKRVEWMLERLHEKGWAIVRPAEAAAAERERLLDPSRLSQAIHAYGGLCRSRYGRVTCGPADHIVMATDLRAALLADPAEPEPSRVWPDCPTCGGPHNPIRSDHRWPEL